MNTASLNLTVGQGGHVFETQLFRLISLEEAPSCNKLSPADDRGAVALHIINGVPVTVTM